MDLMSLEIAILTDDEQVADIVRRYWMLNEEGEFAFKVAEVARHASVKSHVVSRIVKENSYAERTDLSCLRCETYYPVTKRSDATVPLHRLVRDPRAWTCADCLQEAAERARSSKRGRVEASLSTALNQRRVLWDASVRHRLFLLALLKHSADQSLERIQPLSCNQADPLAPSSDMARQVVRELLHSGLISTDPESPDGAYFINDDDELRIYLDRAAWKVTTFLEQPRAEAELMEVNGGGLYVALDNHVSAAGFLSANYDEIRELAWEVTLDEALAYLAHTLAERDLPQRFGEMTHHVLRKALEEYSLGQVYRIIWQAARNASDYLVRNRPPKQQAANTIPGAIESYLERAKANQWEVTPFRRNYALGQSVLSRVLFNSVLGTDDGGFHIPLRTLFAERPMREF